MSNEDIVRAWKDPEYRLTLNEMPPHPAGQIELADPDLDGSSAVNAASFTHGVRGEHHHTHHVTLLCGCHPTFTCE